MLAPRQPCSAPPIPDLRACIRMCVSTLIYMFGTFHIHVCPAGVSTPICLGRFNTSLYVWAVSTLIYMFGQFHINNLCLSWAVLTLTFMFGQAVSH
jgi:hypothetical protein